MKASVFICMQKEFSVGYDPIQYYGILLFPVTLALTGIPVKHSNVLRGYASLGINMDHSNNNNQIGSRIKLMWSPAVEIFT